MVDNSVSRSSRLSIWRPAAPPASSFTMTAQGESSRLLLSLLLPPRTTTNWTASPPGPDSVPTASPHTQNRQGSSRRTEFSALRRRLAANLDQCVSWSMAGRLFLRGSCVPGERIIGSFRLQWPAVHPRLSAFGEVSVLALSWMTRIKTTTPRGRLSGRESSAGTGAPTPITLPPPRRNSMSAWPSPLSMIAPHGAGARTCKHSDWVHWRLDSKARHDLRYASDRRRRQRPHQVLNKDYDLGWADATCATDETKTDKGQSLRSDLLDQQVPGGPRRRFHVPTPATSPQGGDDARAQPREPGQGDPGSHCVAGPGTPRRLYLPVRDPEAGAQCLSLSWDLTASRSRCPVVSNGRPSPEVDLTVSHSVGPSGHQDLGPGPTPHNWPPLWASARDYRRPRRRRVRWWQVVVTLRVRLQSR